MNAKVKIKKQVLVFGEVLFDIYPDGTKKPGGAPFNFAYHLAHLGVDTYLLTRVGNDKNGEEIKKMIAKSPIKTSLIQTDENLPTGIVTITLNKNGVPSFLINSPSAYDNIDFSEFESNIKRTDTFFDMIYYGTLARRGQISSETFTKIIQIDKPIFKFCDINLRSPFYNENFILNTAKFADFLKVSEDELAVITKKELSSDEKTLNAIIKKIAEDFDLKKLCLTMGDKGSVFFDGEHFYKQKTSPADVVDTTGAGDAFSAMLCYCLLNNVETNKMLKMCDLFATKICTIKGAVPDLANAQNFYPDFKTSLFCD